MVGQGGNLEECIDGGEKGNQEDWEFFEECHGRDGAVRLELQDAENEVGDDEDYGRGDDLVKGILQETAEPTPEQPFKLRNDEKRDEHRTNEDADGAGEEAVSDDHDGDSLGRGEKNDHERIEEGAAEVGNARGIDTRLIVVDALHDHLKLCLIDARGEKLRFIGDEVVKAGANAGDGGAVVVDHRESEADGEEQGGEVVEVKGLSAAGCGE